MTKSATPPPKLVQVGGDLIVHDQVHPSCAAGIDQRTAYARITRCDRVDTGQIGNLLQQTERMLVNHIAVIVRQHDIPQLKRRIGGKQLLLKALQTFAVRTVIHTGRTDRSHRAALPRHQTHQLGHCTAGRKVFLPDIAQPVAVGQIGVKHNDRYSALVDQLVDLGFDQQTVERRDRQRIDMMLLDQLLDHRDLLDRIKRGRQPEDDLHAERSQTAGFAPGGIQNDLHERGLHRNNDHADADRMRCAGQCQSGTVGGVAIFVGYRLIRSATAGRTFPLLWSARSTVPRDTPQISAI